MPRDDRSSDDRRLRSTTDQRRLLRSTARLDIPRDLRRTFVPRPTYDADAFGRLS